MAFHDITLPDAFQYGSSAGGGFATIIQQTGTGHEFRVARQSQSQHRMSLRSELRNSSEAKALKALRQAFAGIVASIARQGLADIGASIFRGAVNGLTPTQSGSNAGLTAPGETPRA
jgi:hypothetical protein